MKQGQEQGGEHRAVNLFRDAVRAEHRFRTSPRFPRPSVLSFLKDLSGKLVESHWKRPGFCLGRAARFALPSRNVLGQLNVRGGHQGVDRHRLPLIPNCQFGNQEIGEALRVGDHLDEGRPCFGLCCLLPSLDQVFSEPRLAVGSRVECHDIGDFRRCEMAVQPFHKMHEHLPVRCGERWLIGTPSGEHVQPGSDVLGRITFDVHPIMKGRCIGSSLHGM